MLWLELVMFYLNVIDKWVKFSFNILRPNLMLFWLYIYDLQLIWFSLFVWIGFCSDSASIITLIGVGYCPVHELCQFYRVSVHWLCEYFWVDMISSDYNGNYLHIVLLTKWYQSVAITSRWQLWPYLWTVETQRTKSMVGFYACFIVMAFYIHNWLNDLDPMQINNDCFVSHTIWFTIDCIHETILLRFDSMGKTKYSCLVPIAFFWFGFNLRNSWIISN